jgi:hypothetical protein
MKRITSIALCVLASLAAVGSASAQDHAVKATIPFGFYVGNKWLPSGTYELTSDSRSPDIIKILDAAGTVEMLSLAESDDHRSKTGTLVFRKYGDQYFLHEVLSSAGHMNVSFQNSKREKWAQTHETATVSAPSTVYLALK